MMISRGLFLAGEAVEVELEEELDAENQKMDPLPAAVPFSQLFACAKRTKRRHSLCGATYLTNMWSMDTIYNYLPL